MYSVTVLLWESYDSVESDPPWSVLGIFLIIGLWIFCVEYWTIGGYLLGVTLID